MTLARLRRSILDAAIQCADAARHSDHADDRSAVVAFCHFDSSAADLYSTMTAREFERGMWRRAASK